MGWHPLIRYLYLWYVVVEQADNQSTAADIVFIVDLQQGQSRRRRDAEHSDPVTEVICKTCTSADVRDSNRGEGTDVRTRCSVLEVSGDRWTTFQVQYIKHPFWISPG